MKVKMASAVQVRGHATSCWLTSECQHGVKSRGRCTEEDPSRSILIRVWEIRLKFELRQGGRKRIREWLEIVSDPQHLTNGRWLGGVPRGLNTESFC